ncbi:F-box/FBD/LRR-repeat protein At1g13570-like [Aegilops tauschii subsp. strangulata]|uniref:F-box/FBD/LRR-repeat protein At1g13570-like n=1 Tax=Aegilops tauschii subsp. strangulata TaxID=200361 RepID=UPI00098B621A|nr:uncharacterized protein LOC109773951 [Aegilops tauschii subsp. strangulata]
MDLLMDRILRCLPAPPEPITNTTGALPLPAAFEDIQRRRVNISALAEDIQRQIVSKLPMKEAGRTTVLSSGWRYIWRSTPLDLDANSLIPSGDNGSDDPDAVVSRVSQVIGSHEGPFRSVHLNSKAILHQKSKLREWFQALARKGVQDLCTSLVRLYVAVCNFPYTGLRPAADVRFLELLELGLCSVGLCEVDLDRVLAGSPKLEKLAFVCGRVALTRIDLVSPRLRCVLFWHAVPSHQLAVVDAPRLERIILWEDDAYCKTPAKIKIGSAPLLRAIGYLNPTLHVLQIGDELIMAGTSASPTAEVPSVNILAIDFQFGAAKEERMVLSFLTCFPRIQILHVKNGGSLFKTFVDSDGTLWKKKIDPIKSVKSTIEKIVLYGFCGGDSELSFFKSILKSANKLKEICIVFSDDVFSTGTEADMDEKWRRAAASVELANVTLQIFRVHKHYTWNYKTASDLLLSDPFDCLT